MGDRRRGAAAHCCGVRTALLLLVAGLLPTSSCLLPKYSVSSDALPGSGGGQGGGDPADAGGGSGGVTGAGGRAGSGGVTGAGGRAGSGGVTGAGGGPGSGGVTGAGGSVDAAVDARGDGPAGDLAPPRCGDQVCNAGETETTCCKDCGCSGGRYCSSSNCVVANGVMTWSFDDNCDDGRGIQYRLFDLDNNNVWPDRVSAFQVPAGQMDQIQTIACVLAATICYGAVSNPYDGVHFWGVGLDGTQPRNAGFCAVCGRDNPAYILRCDP